MPEKQLVLQPRRTVKRDVAVLLFQRRDPALKLLLARGTNGEPYLRIEHRGVPAGLELRLILASEDTIDAGQHARAMSGTLELLVVGVLDIGDPLAYLGERLAVAEPPAVNDGVDGEPDRLKRREENLGGRTRELRCFSERADREH